MAEIYTTQELSLITGYWPSTIAGWCKTGKLKHKRAPKGGTRAAYLIDMRDFWAFVKRYRVPLDPDVFTWYFGDIPDWAKDWPIKSRNRGRRYSDREIRFLIRNYRIMSLRELAEHLGRSMMSVAVQLHRLRRQGKVGYKYEGWAVVQSK